MTDRRPIEQRDPDAGNPFLQGLTGIGIVTGVALGFGAGGMLAALVIALLY